MRLSLRQLEVFDAICRLGSVTAAAQDVSLSQSAASQALAELEAALDGALFDRIGRRLQINERGEQLRPYAAELLERAEIAEASLRGRHAMPPPRVRLAASLTIGAYLLPELLGAHLLREPEARVELQIHNTLQVIDEVAAFRADAGFVEGLIRHPDLLTHRWRDDEMLIVVAPDHPLARRRLTVAHLAAARWITREAGSGGREIFGRAAHAAGFTPRIALELGHPQAVLRAAATGAGVACLSQFVVADAVARGELVALKTPFLDLHRTLWLVRHRNKFIGPGLRTMLDVLAPGVLIEG
ncbi:LysR substrate-binding domain-containing protein [Solimonas marina]|uniref:LysR family transcriptional regulator n=1 Tax=Solimonas marina TaxID=2714601 RepID=A0A970B6H7_9GAMM|nr:LysR substrate-binding domain-containing protein [Solimonas marina]NKF22808.1 LysR family transcriptional regulator [Solimonas marina]